MKTRLAMRCMGGLVCAGMIGWGSAAWAADEAVPAAEPAVEATAAAPMSGAYPVAAGAPEETAAPAAPTEGAGAEPRGGEMGDDWPAAALETAPVEAGVAEEAAKPRRRSIRDLVRGGEA